MPSALGKPGEQWRSISLMVCRNCGTEWKPEHRTLCVPIIPPPEMQIRYGDYAPDLAMRMTEQVRVQAKEFRLDITQPGGGTRIVWWGWEPTAEAHKPDVRYRLSRAAAMGSRVRECFDQLFGTRYQRENRSAFFDYIDPLRRFDIEGLRIWVDTVLEDVEQALGQP